MGRSAIYIYGDIAVGTISSDVMIDDVAGSDFNNLFFQSR
jgi:hypothetical protein